MFNNFPQSDIDIVAADGTLRHRVKAIVDGNKFTIPDTTITIVVGDEIRRKLPNGTEEAFEVLDPSFHTAFHAIPAHYVVKTRRRGSFVAGQGGNYTINVTGSNARVNLHSTDYSLNVVNEPDVFSRLAEVIDRISDVEQRQGLQILNKEMQKSAETGGNFLTAYQRFIQAANQHIQLIAPFIPALTQYLGQ